MFKKILLINFFIFALFANTNNTNDYNKKNYKNYNNTKKTVNKIIYNYICKSIYIIDPLHKYIENFKNEKFLLFQKNINYIIINKDNNIIKYEFSGKGKIIDETLKENFYYIYKNNFLNVNLYVPLYKDEDIPDKISNNLEIYIEYKNSLKAFICLKKK